VHENTVIVFSKATLSDCTIQSLARLYSTNWLFLLFHLFLGYVMLQLILLSITTLSNWN
jgi:hypothetical protein